VAFRDISDIEGIPTFYNLTMAVGDGAPNKRDDVMLVQFLLSEVHKGATAFVPAIPKPTGELKVDGIYGPVTRRFLLNFQTQVQKMGIAIAADGRADKVVRGVISSISRTIYTVFFLNIKVAQVRPDFQDLHLSSDVPDELAFQLF
jgi:hypothetical protein